MRTLFIIFLFAIPIQSNQQELHQDLEPKYEDELMIRELNRDIQDLIEYVKNANI